MRKHFMVIFMIFGIFTYGMSGTTFSVGFQGLGSKWSAATPTFRWKFENQVAFDLTPTLIMRHTTYSQSSSLIYQKRIDVGVTAGIYKSRSILTSLTIGHGVEFGYIQALENLKRENLAVTSRGEYSVNFAYGLDLEVMLPIETPISIGSQSGLRFEYWESSSRISRKIIWVSQILTIRYYL